MYELPRIVSISGAVSPITREIAKSIPVKMPGKAEGNQTLKIIAEYEVPSESAASLRLTGKRLRVFG